MATAQQDDDASTSSTEDLSSQRPSLERLVSHFVAAKRSLSSVNQVWRANEIVAAARSSLEIVASLNARNRYLRGSVEDQVRTLKAVRHGVGVVSRDGHADFKSVLLTLDAADMRVKQTLSILKSTPVEPSFRPDLPPPKTLYDFVDEHSVDNLTLSFHACIDATNDAQDALGDLLAAFDAELLAIDTAFLLPPPSPPSHPSSEGDEGKHDLASTASSFRALEARATEMASSLQALARHYDFCMTALKHTEGGGEAAEQASVALLPAGVVVGSGDDRGDGYTNTNIPERDAASASPAPISEEERAEMLRVLDKDAAEVEDVVLEIREHTTEMEWRLEHIAGQVQRVQVERNGLVTALRLLREVGAKLPGYVAGASIYIDRWAEQKARIEERMEELEGVRVFYEGFLRAYDGLIGEIARRERVREVMEGVVRHAMEEVQRLYDADVEEREAFKQEQGAYLPSDLWPGLMDPPPRFEIRQLRGVDATLPEPSHDAVREATQRSTK